MKALRSEQAKRAEATEGRRRSRRPSYSILLPSTLQVFLAAAVLLVEVLLGPLQSADPFGSVMGLEVLEEIFYLLWTFYKKRKNHGTSAPSASLAKIGGGV